MSGLEREERLAAACVELAGTLAGEFDIMDYLHNLTEHASALLRADEATRRLETARIPWDEGPCRDCARTGAATPGIPLDAPATRRRWPRFAPLAVRHGFATVAGTPLRLHDRVIGALNSFHAAPRALTEHERYLAQALASAAAIGILQHRSVRDHMTLSARLQAALESRVVIEQAKGALAARGGVSIDAAFAQLRAHARRHRIRLTNVAHDVLDGTAPLDLPGSSPPSGRRRTTGTDRRILTMSNYRDQQVP
ncbi:GAF and ANTAR domain-containing protein [Streptomyces sp. H27-D2]|uniref:GAF and ANTAR domain-containing protein n=1 Tax=Streptomyces sp. H27-D2 TaxID=3046304 RepID=UPI002DBFC743|nr:GAF and ANTAR domain-containing protein [Streptomyces sp. H27-D2]MEC4020503.1 GAF and ANTAR domain-containing protein [Streptomyces sp. H27-D2]